MPAKKHLHTYQRSKLNKEYFQCADSECSHYLHRKLLAGKKALCMCMREFILDYESLRRATPKCSFCSHSKVAIKMQTASSIMDTLLAGKEVTDMPADTMGQSDNVEVQLEDVQLEKEVEEVEELEEVEEDDEDES
jgi:hypothetical protein